MPSRACETLRAEKNSIWVLDDSCLAYVASFLGPTALGRLACTAKRFAEKTIVDNNTEVTEQTKLNNQVHSHRQFANFQPSTAPGTRSASHIVVSENGAVVSFEKRDLETPAGAPPSAMCGAMSTGRHFMQVVISSAIETPDETPDPSVLVGVVSDTNWARLHPRECEVCAFASAGFIGNRIRSGRWWNWNWNAAATKPDDRLLPGDNPGSSAPNLTFGYGDQIGLLLDGDTGTLEVFKNSQSLGLIVDPCAGDRALRAPLHFFVARLESDDITVRLSQTARPPCVAASAVIIPEYSIVEEAARISIGRDYSLLQQARTPRFRTAGSTHPISWLRLLNEQQQLEQPLVFTRSTDATNRRAQVLPVDFPSSIARYDTCTSELYDAYESICDVPMRAGVHCAEFKFLCSHSELHHCNQCSPGFFVGIANGEWVAEPNASTGKCHPMGAIHSAYCSWNGTLAGDQNVALDGEVWNEDWSGPANKGPDGSMRLGEGDTIGLRLDFESGTLSVYKPDGDLDRVICRNILRGRPFYWVCCNMVMFQKVQITRPRAITST